MKEKQDQHPIFLELKSTIHKQKVMDFEHGGDGVLRYQGRMCSPKVDFITGLPWSCRLMING